MKTSFTGDTLRSNTNGIFKINENQPKKSSCFISYINQHKFYINKKKV